MSAPSSNERQGGDRRELGGLDLTQSILFDPSELADIGATIDFDSLETEDDDADGLGSEIAANTPHIDLKGDSLVEGRTGDVGSGGLSKEDSLDFDFDLGDGGNVDLDFKLDSTGEGDGVVIFGKSGSTEPLPTSTTTTTSADGAAGGKSSTAVVEDEDAFKKAMDDIYARPMFGDEDLDKVLSELDVEDDDDDVVAHIGNLEGKETTTKTTAITNENKKEEKEKEKELGLDDASRRGVERKDEEKKEEVPVGIGSDLGITMDETLSPSQMIELSRLGLDSSDPDSTTEKEKEKEKDNDREQEKEREPYTYTMNQGGRGRGGGGVESASESEDGEEGMGPEEARMIVEDELSSGTPSLPRVRSLCKKFGVPRNIRGALWKYLLGVERQSASVMAGWDDGLDSPQTLSHEEAQLLADSKTTRPELDVFRSASTQKTLARVLRFYCQRRSMSYRPHLNDLVAPFLVLELPEGVVFNCFYAFVAKFLPILATDDVSVQPCINQLFRLLLLYHDQELCARIDQSHLSHFQFASVWFITLLAKVSSMDAILRVWDSFFLTSDPFMCYYFVLAFLISKRETILGADIVDVETTLHGLQLTNPDDVPVILAQAKVFEAATPRAFRHQLYAINFQTKEFGGWIRRFLYTQNPYASPTALQVSASEILDALAAPAQSASIKYVLFDCRTEDEYQNGHLPTAFHLPPRMLLERPDEFRELMHKFFPLKGIHFCFLGSGQSELEPYLELIILQFLQRGFIHISVLHGGYRAVHALYLDRNPNAELTDHNPDGCLVCRSRAPQQQQQRTPVKGRQQQQRPKPRPQQPQKQQPQQKAPPAKQAASDSPVSVSTPTKASPTTSSTATTPVVPVTSEQSSSESSDASSTPTTAASTTAAAATTPTGSSGSKLFSAFSSISTKVKVPTTSPIDFSKVKTNLFGSKRSSLPVTSPSSSSSSKGTTEGTAANAETNSKSSGDDATTKEGTTKEESPKGEMSKEAEMRKQRDEGKLFSTTITSLKEGEALFTIDDSAEDSPRTNGGSDSASLLPALEPDSSPTATEEPKKSDQQTGVEPDKPSESTSETTQNENAGAAESDAKKPDADVSSTQQKPLPSRGFIKKIFSWGAGATAAPKQSAGGASAAGGPQVDQPVVDLRAAALERYENELRAMVSGSGYLRITELVEAHPLWMFFSCKRVFDSYGVQLTAPWHLMVTECEVVDLRVNETEPYLVQVEDRHLLSELLKITYKRRNRKLLSFVYNRPEPMADTTTTSELPTTATSSSDSTSPSSSSSAAVDQATPGASEASVQQSEHAAGSSGASDVAAPSSASPAPPQQTIYRYLVGRPDECIEFIQKAIQTFNDQQT